MGVVVGAPWLSGSASASTYERSASDSAPVSLLPVSRSLGFSVLRSSPDPVCEISQGVYPRLVGEGVPDWLPSWVEPSGGLVCVQLDASSLLDSPGQTVPQEPEPLPLPGESFSDQSLAAIRAELAGMRELVLYLGGVLIFCSAALIARSRKG